MSLRGSNHPEVGWQTAYRDRAVEVGTEILGLDPVNPQHVIKPALLRRASDHGRRLLRTSHLARLVRLDLRTSTNDHRLPWPFHDVRQSAAIDLAACIPRLTRCVEEYGAVALNLNPDPSGGHCTAPPLSLATQG
jgi:hypothetical protein